MEFILEDSLYRPLVKRWGERIKKRFEPVSRETILLPCSAKKPYGSSKSHIRVRKALGRRYRRINKVTLTSPLGIVPEELEFIFPANCYDTSVSGYWSDEEIENSKNLLSYYLEKLGKQNVLAYLEGDYTKVVKDLDLTLVSSPKELSENLEGNSPIKKTREYISQASRFQFGVDLTEGPLRILREKVIEGKEFLFTIDSFKGKLKLTKLSAQRLASKKKNQVHIDFRLKSENLFSPGVRKADQGILPGDEVIVIENGKLRGFGEATVPGPVMGKLEGLAVSLRKLISA